MKSIHTLRKHLLFFVLLMALMGTLTSGKRACKKQPKPLALSSIHIVDRNGFMETITNKDRLEQFQGTNFLSQQPYEKVLRIYERDSKGNVRAIVTSYHANGNPKQFLEILNARAYGNYREWHPNGVMSVCVRVIGGNPDITPNSEKTWLFDGASYAWDEEGHVLAEIQYSQGSLNGKSIYYHPCGKVWKTVPYSNGEIDGVLEVYKATGELLQQMNFAQGYPHGTAKRFWDPNQIASQEEFCQGKLESGLYFDKNGQLISEIKQGSGFRAIFGKDEINELHEYRQGELEGEIKVFNAQGRIKRLYHICKGIKHGEEIEYYEFPRPDPTNPGQMIEQPRLSFYWYEGKIQGIAKTWYSNGVQESQREMSNNAKNGVATAWYRDGNLMLIEQYEQDKLIRGDYFKKGDKTPVSQVIQGRGTATLFDADGHFVQKVMYENGKPDL
jgi:antitoxin component YwqK of YwqJK toxin-antitoxin module